MPVTTEKKLPPRAFRCTVGEVTGIVFATTASKARWICKRSADDSGCPIEFSATRVTRAPDYDARETAGGTPARDRVFYCEDFLVKKGERAR